MSVAPKDTRLQQALRLRTKLGNVSDQQTGVEIVQQYVLQLGAYSTDAAWRIHRTIEQTMNNKQYTINVVQPGAYTTGTA